MRSTIQRSSGGRAGTGRQAGFRSRCSKERVGSSPSARIPDLSNILLTSVAGARPGGGASLAGRVVVRPFPGSWGDPDRRRGRSPLISRSRRSSASAPRGPPPAVGDEGDARVRWVFDARRPIDALGGPDACGLGGISRGGPAASEVHASPVEALAAAIAAFGLALGDAAARRARWGEPYPAAGVGPPGSRDGHRRAGPGSHGPGRRPGPGIHRRARAVPGGHHRGGRVRARSGRPGRGYRPPGSFLRATFARSRSASASAPDRCPCERRAHSRSSWRKRSSCSWWCSPPVGPEAH